MMWPAHADKPLPMGDAWAACFPDVHMQSEDVDCLPAWQIVWRSWMRPSYADVRSACIQLGDLVVDTNGTSAPVRRGALMVAAAAHLGWPSFNVNADARLSEALMETKWGAFVAAMGRDEAARLERIVEMAPGLPWALIRAGLEIFKVARDHQGKHPVLSLIRLRMVLAKTKRSLAPLHRWVERNRWVFCLSKFGQLYFVGYSLLARVWSTRLPGWRPCADHFRLLDADGRAACRAVLLLSKRLSDTGPLHLPPEIWRRILSFAGSCGFKQHVNVAAELSRLFLEAPLYRGRHHTDKLYADHVLEPFTTCLSPVEFHVTRAFAMIFQDRTRNDWVDIFGRLWPTYVEMIAALFGEGRRMAACGRLIEIIKASGKLPASFWALPQWQQYARIQGDEGVQRTFEDYLVRGYHLCSALHRDGITIYIRASDAVVVVIDGDHLLSAAEEFCAAEQPPPHERSKAFRVVAEFAVGQLMSREEIPAETKLRLVEGAIGKPQYLTDIGKELGSAAHFERSRI